MKIQKTARIVADLPDEVITTHIFPRLSVESVGRCRCVSKPWRSVLTTPEFTKTHLKFHADDPEELIIQCLDSLHISTFTDEAAAVSRKVKFPTFEAFTEQAVPRKVKLRLFHDSPVWCEIVGSCNGLVLIRTHKKYFTMILVNPVTLEYVNVPEASNPFAEFEPTYGLGYDSCSDDYKVVKLSQSDSSNDYDEFGVHVFVYSVKMKSWRRVGRHPPYHHDDSCRSWSKKSGVFLNGYIHWMVGAESISESSYSITIAAFDLAREKFDHIPLPSGAVVNEEDTLEIKVSDGRLALIHWVPRADSKWYCFTDVWVMEEYGVSNSWTKHTTLNPPENGSHRPDSFKCMLNVDEILVERSSMQLSAYNWRNGVWRDVSIAGYKGSLGRPSILAFRKSIVSPNVLL